MKEIKVLPLQADLNESNVKSLENQVMNLISQGCYQIVLEGANVHKVEWPAVGKIVGLKRMLKQFEGDIKIAGLKETVKDPFYRFGVNYILEMYPDVNKALSSFNENYAEAYC